jgi:hypothetical protein
MPVNYPKFDKKIQDQIDLSALKQSKTRPGMIAVYDRVTNTATIILEEQVSEAMGNVIRNVPCPVIRGIQSVSPVVGTRCLVGFRDNNESNPYVLNYFEDTNISTTYYSNYSVDTGIPRFMVD